MSPEDPEFNGKIERLVSSLQRYYGMLDNNEDQSALLEALTDVHRRLVPLKKNVRAKFSPDEVSLKELAKALKTARVHSAAPTRVAVASKVMIMATACRIALDTMIYPSLPPDSFPACVLPATAIELKLDAPASAR